LSRQVRGIATPHSMWNTLPKDLLKHVGTFVFHRDVRCIQAACTDWKHIWAGLRCPHPDVYHIELCDAQSCQNRTYVIDTIEPFLACDVTRYREIVRSVKFMLLMVPYSCLVSMSRSLHLVKMERSFIRSRHSLIYWCNCRHFPQKRGDMPHVLVGRSPNVAPRWLFKHTVCENLILIWCLLLVGTSSSVFAIAV
jgi:hypothetical protein